MSKRASTRNVVLSKAMKHVDEETRREFREKRLQALESDNYVEGEVAQVDDDAYAESEVSRLFHSVCQTVRWFIHLHIIRTKVLHRSVKKQKGTRRTIQT